MELRLHPAFARGLALPLEPQTTADFYSRLMTTLSELFVRVKIHPRPSEVALVLRVFLPALFAELRRRARQLRAYERAA